MSRHKLTHLRCQCGRVDVEARGAPIAAVACYCDDCQAGGHQLEALPNAAAVVEPDGRTDYVLYRRDRVTPTNGAELLKPYKLRERSTTNRVVASCCNSPMYLSFDRGPHWVTVYRARLGTDAPPIEALTRTKFAPAGAELPRGIPSYETAPLGLVVKLLASRLAMLVRD